MCAESFCSVIFVVSDEQCGCQSAPPWSRHQSDFPVVLIFFSAPSRVAGSVTTLLSRQSVEGDKYFSTVHRKIGVAADDDVSCVV